MRLSRRVDDREAVEQHAHLVALLEAELAPARGGDEAQSSVPVDAHRDLAAHPAPADGGDGAMELLALLAGQTVVVSAPPRAP